MEVPWFLGDQGPDLKLVCYIAHSAMRMLQEPGRILINRSHQQATKHGRD
jgi:hypothetical protein